jgi:hypothetical protein
VGRRPRCAVGCSRSRAHSPQEAPRQPKSTSSTPRLARHGRSPPQCAGQHPRMVRGPLRVRHGLRRFQPSRLRAAGRYSVASISAAYGADGERSALPSRRLSPSDLCASSGRIKASRLRLPVRFASASPVHGSVLGSDSPLTMLVDRTRDRTMFVLKRIRRIRQIRHTLRVIYRFDFFCVRLEAICLLCTVPAAAASIDALCNANRVPSRARILRYRVLSHTQQTSVPRPRAQRLRL